MWGAFLLGLSRARLTYLGLAGLVYLLYPRFATWRITEMWYSTFFLGSDLSTHIELDIGVEVYVSLADVLCQTHGACSS